MDDKILSSGSCRQACTEEGYTVMALHLTKCHCGRAYPPQDSLAKDDKCDFPCPGFSLEACGGRAEPGFYSVWNLGVDMDPGHSDKEEKSDSVGTSTPSKSPKPSTIEPPVSASPTPTPVPSGITADTPAPPSKTGDGDNGSAGLNFAAVLGTAIFGAAAAVAGAAYL